MRIFMKQYYFEERDAVHASFKAFLDKKKEKKKIQPQLMMIKQEQLLLKDRVKPVTRKLIEGEIQYLLQSDSFYFS